MEIEVPTDTSVKVKSTCWAEMHRAVKYVRSDEFKPASYTSSQSSSSSSSSVSISIVRTGQQQQQSTQYVTISDNNQTQYAAEIHVLTRTNYRLGGIHQSVNEAY